MPPMRTLTLLAVALLGCEAADDGDLVTDATAADFAVEADAGADVGSLDAARDGAPADVAPPDGGEAPDLGPDAAPVDPLALAVDAPGPFAVGFRAFPITYEHAGEARTITINLWYPATAAEGPPARYLGTLTDLESHVGAPPAASIYGGGFPLLVYSHGDRGLGGDAAHLSRRFASHGWLVAAPDHAGNTLPEGTIDTLAHYQRRPLDISRAIDAVEAEYTVLTTIAVGHSRGTYTMFAVGGATYDVPGIAARCAAVMPDDPLCNDDGLAPFAVGFRDPRIAGIVPMAGNIRRSWHGAEGHREIAVPILWLTGSADENGVIDEWPAFEALESTWLEIAGGCHLTFTLGACGTLDKEVGFAIIERYVLAFARRHGLGDRSQDALLDGADAPPEVTLRAHRP